MAEKLIGLRAIDKLEPGKTIWDGGKGSVSGFGARRQKGDVVAYILKYRTKEGRQRWHTIGRHGSPWTPEMARDEARKLLGKVTEGDDPAADKQKTRSAATVAELCDLYLKDAEAGRLLTRSDRPKRASTLRYDRGRIERHIKPRLGRLPVTAVSRQDITSFLHDIAAGKTAARIKTKKRGLARVTGGKGAASRAVGLLGSIFTYAVEHGMRSDNPVHGVRRFKDGQRKRRLTEPEYLKLGEALRMAADIWPPAIAATHFLAVTGWRTSEATKLRWSELNLTTRTITIDTKTGESTRPLSHAACDILRSLNKASELVFPATRGDGPISFSGHWKHIAKAAGLPDDVTPHTLRHSFASLAGDLRYSEPTIAELIGHKGRTTTSRYVHIADPVVLAAADAVANETMKRMGFRTPSATVTPIRRMAK